MLWIALVPLFLVGVAVAVVPLIVGMIAQQRDARPAPEVGRIMAVTPRPQVGRPAPAPADLAA